MTDEDKLELYFLAFALGEIQGKPPDKGKIVTMDHKEHTVNLEQAEKNLGPFLSPLRAWIEAPPQTVPSPSLRKHCQLCQFDILCKAEAEKLGHISLLQGLTPKTVLKYEAKGIFSIEQLSYLFKPRKRRKPRALGKVTFSPELQALAIRTGKIYLLEIPCLLRQQVEIFLDIEGIPDRKVYYLIGLLIRDPNTLEHHAYWADTAKNERDIWHNVVEKIREYPEAPIFHYGSYEPRAIETLGHRYGRGVVDMKDRLVNINAHIFGKLYFPARSNSLKELGRLVGASWSAPNASGLQSLVWWHHWETTQDPRYRDLLTTYNREDCEALRLVTDEITRIQEDASSSSQIDFAHRPKQQSTERGARLHDELQALLKFAHGEYEKKRISVKKEDKRDDHHNSNRGPRKGHPASIRRIPKATKTVRVPRRRKCLRHRGETLKPTGDMASQTVIDLVFTKNGVRKSMTKYYGTRSYCRKCEHSFAPHAIERLGGRLFGRRFRAWAVYQRLCLRLPYSAIIRVMEDQFRETMSESSIVNFINEFSAYYCDTEKMLVRRILESPCVYVDETKISIEGHDHYVWVFTNGRHTIFRLTDSREALIVHQALEKFMGVLVSEFYPGYDSVKCKQQKCWSHLIRDLNEDLWKSPFDNEFEAFVAEVKNLILPILRAVEKFGLKRRHLNKFHKDVQRFYDRVIMRTYSSEVVLRYQKRFSQYKERLFTFIALDEVDWNNNAAERALRHLAVQRRISGSFNESVSRSFLLLLGISQTCRFQDKSLLKFLLSGEKDIDRFRRKTPLRNSQPAGRNWPGQEPPRVG